jgi:hypothetical protein
MIRQTNAAGSLVLTNGSDVQGTDQARDTGQRADDIGLDQSWNVTNVDYPASIDLRFTYDWMNQLVQMVDAAGTTDFSYNENRTVKWRPRTGLGMGIR